ncbi:hypothetical protein E4U16_004985, partial [Claviceps sp. LM84 group G4]
AALEHLEEIAINVWEDMEIQLVNDLIDSPPRRLQAVEPPNVIEGMGVTTRIEDAIIARNVSTRSGQVEPGSIVPCVTDMKERLLPAATISVMPP